MAEKEEKVVVNHTAARRVSMLHAQSALRRATLAISKESTPSPRDTPAIEEEDKIFQSGTLIKKGWDGWYIIYTNTYMHTHSLTYIHEQQDKNPKIFRTDSFRTQI